jgi:hypothetical protein
MLDLEENHNDMHSLQQSLGTSYTDDEETDWGLELQFLMNEESLVSTPALCNSIATRTEKEDAPKPTTDVGAKEVVAAVPEIIEEGTDEKKGEHAVIE